MRITDAEYLFLNTDGSPQPPGVRVGMPCLQLRVDGQLHRLIGEDLKWVQYGLDPVPLEGHVPPLPTMTMPPIPEIGLNEPLRLRNYSRNPLLYSYARDFAFAIHALARGDAEAFEVGPAPPQPAHLVELGRRSR